MLAGARACTNSSLLPSAPSSGESIQPMMVAPAASRAHRPRPGPARGWPGPGSRPCPSPPRPARPRTAASPAAPGRRPGRAHASRAGSTVRSEMNDRSATTTSTGPPIAAASRWRTLVRSRLSTRGSPRSRSWSWPCPTSTATTDAAPRWSTQSVKPPVEAPASSTRRPATSTAKVASAASSFSPPRLTNRGPGRARHRLVGGDQARHLERRRAPHGDPPAATAGWASLRLVASPRRTSSASSRRRAATTA